MISKEDTVIMKRVKAACICQTLHFMLKEDVAHDWAVKQVEQDGAQPYPIQDGRPVCPAGWLHHGQGHQAVQ